MISPVYHCAPRIGAITATTSARISSWSGRVECRLWYHGCRAGACPVASIEPILRGRDDQRRRIGHRREREVDRLIDRYAAAGGPLRVEALVAERGAQR